MSIIINPGSGPVDEADEGSARANMQTLADDLREQGCEVGEVTLRQDEGDGRWSFDINVNGTAREVAMPGLPIEQVRWVDDPDQNIWHFPRLYVDGSSWVWLFALGVLAEPEDPDEDDQ